MANDLKGRVQTKLKKGCGRKKSDEEISVMDSVFRHPCGCKVCRKFDRLKEESKNKVKQENVKVESKLTFPCLPVPDVPSPAVKPKVRQENRKRGVRTLTKPKSFESFNRFGILKRDDPGHGLLGSAPAGNVKVQRGGGNRKKVKMSTIFEETISVAKKHGIALIADKPNAARGDCLFECVIDNINNRPESFPEKLQDGIDTYRELFVSEMAERFKSTAAYPGYGGNPISDETLGEWTAAWAKQMNPCEYNVQAFNVSDLVPLGLGHCIKRHILVFTNNPNEEVQVFSANFFDETIVPESDVPVVIAYDINGFHYESLLPKNELNVRKCAALVKSLLDETYDVGNPSDFWNKDKNARNAKRKRDQRSKESVKGRAERLDKKKAKMAESRSNESAEERAARLDKVKENMSKSRSNESANERADRLDKDKSKKTESRKNESAQTKSSKRQMRKDKRNENLANELGCHQGFANCAKVGESPHDVAPLDLGQMDEQCSECGAWMFPWETNKVKDDEKIFSLCCSYGKYKLPPQPEFPELLQRLMTGDDSECREFRAHIREYNNALSFASRGFSGRPFVFNNTRGPPVFKVSGQMFHCMGNVLPSEGKSPKFSQMYVFDEDYELENRMNNVSGLNKNTLKNLQEMIHQYNAFAKVYINAAQKMKAENTVDVQMVLKARTNENAKKVYMYPKSKDVAIVIPNRADNDQRNPRDVILYKTQEANPKGNQTVRIHSLHRAYVPSAYPMLFPWGNYGFELDGQNTCNGVNINVLKYYRYMIMDREDDPRTATLHKGGRLYQEFLCDMYNTVEEARLAYHERNQMSLRGETLDGLADAISSSDGDDTNIGKEVKLPSSFVLSQRWMVAYLLDAMAIARKYQKFTFFITMTCDPTMVDSLERMAGQMASDRPDLLDRMFNKHMKTFFHDLTVNGIMGKARAWVTVFERQMRGLWHAHISLLTNLALSEGEIDDWIQCQIPDEEEDPEYYELVKKHMVHGPCGKRNPNAPCMILNKSGAKVCRAGFPKPFNEKTHLQQNGYPNYARPNNGRVIRKGSNVFTNQDVVAHNRYVLLKYKCHCNVEYTATLSTVRYQFKYQHKGNDLATIQLESNEAGKAKNEISMYVNSRFIDPHLAVWRIFEYKVQDRFPAVMRLDIHEEDKQFVYFKPGQEGDKVDKPKVTKLMAWLCYNRDQYNRMCDGEEYDENYDQFTYMQFPEHYTYNESAKEDCHKWRPRKNRKDFVECIGRIYTVPRTTDDKYFLRMLLHHQKGATCFADIRTVDGIVHETYKSAAGALGLLSDDREIVYAMQETWTFGSSAKLRNLFAILLSYGEISDPAAIFDQFLDMMMDDFRNKKKYRYISEEDVQNRCLVAIDDLLQDMGSSMADHPVLPQPNHQHDKLTETRAFRRERYEENVQQDKLDTLLDKLANNQEQYLIYKKITGAIDGRLPVQYVINAPGGYGKSFLFQCISTDVRSKGGIALCCASTGIAAWNLEGGRTAHSMFKIPIDADIDSTSNVRVQTSEAAVIREANVIIWDEIFNVHQYNIAVVDRLLRDVMGNKLPFGGKVVVFGGDPRQTPPVVKKGKRGETVAASFKSSPLYANIEECHLTKNMRVRDGDEEFCEWLLQIGEGTINEDEDDEWVEIPKQHLAKSKMDLIEHTFPNLESMGKEEMMSSGVFCPRNDDAFEINKICLNKLPGQARTYLSCDRVEEEDCISAQTELLNSRRPSGFPDHNLILKVGAPIMLLRNLQCGLVNGTRMIVKAMHDKVLECEIMVGHRKGEIVFIPRIPLYDRSNDYPWTMVRIQFPVRVCFAMTIHKGQGQSMLRVGVYVAQQMFAHGQLYVAVSRAILASGLKLFIEGNETKLRNIVYREIL